MFYTTEFDKTCCDSFFSLYKTFFVFFLILLTVSYLIFDFWITDNHQLKKGCFSLLLQVIILYPF